ncbi:MAG: MFS transporter [Chloroflexi bacterium]|nr:MFS transporter [Chloroflexota bacterium]
METLSLKGNFVVVLRNRHFLVLWLAQAVSQTAQNVINFALIIAVETVSHSSTQVSIVILAFTVPAVVFSAVAGVFVDRTNKKTMLVVTNVLRGLAVLGYIFSGRSWPVFYLLLTVYLITLLFATISQFFGPAEAAMIPLLVGRNHLVTANSMFNLTFTASQLLGFAVLGPLLAKVVGLSTLFIVVFVMYMVASALTALLPSKEPRLLTANSTQGNGLQKVWSELREGWAFIVKDRILVTALVHLSLASSLFLILGTLGTGFVNRVIGIPAEDLAYIVAPAGIGMLIGVLLVNRFATEQNRETMINAGLGAIGVSLFFFAIAKPGSDLIFGLFGQTPPLSLVVGIVMFMGGLAGLTNAFVAIPAQTVILERSPEDIRGRVFSVFFMLSNAAALFPILFAGSLADLIGIVQVMVIIAVLVSTVSAVSFYLHYTAHHHPYTDIKPGR